MGEGEEEKDLELPLEQAWHWKVGGVQSESVQSPARLGVPSGGNGGRGVAGSEHTGKTNWTH